jgi:hypothetical protein
MVEQSLAIHESGQEVVRHCVAEAGIVVGEPSAGQLQFGEPLLGSQVVAVKGGDRRPGSEDASRDEVVCEKSLDEHAELSVPNQQILRRN